MGEIKEKTEKKQDGKPSYSNQLMRTTESLMTAVIDQFQVNGMNLDDYQIQCGRNAIAAISNALDGRGVKITDPSLDQSNLSQIIEKVVGLKLNANATPRECYFQVRNVNIKGSDGKATKDWKKQIEFGIEGDGWDSLLRNFGVGIKTVHKPWLVRTGDDFEYPNHQGLTVTDPSWKETGEGTVSRVVYPVEKTDGKIEWLISERADVRKNLIAHINNNAMNETFGICNDRYKATEKEKEQIEIKKQEFKTKLNSIDDFEEILDNPKFEKWISPAWTEGHSREEMIIRKMRNNAIKKYPKNYGNGFIEKLYMQASDSDISTASIEIQEHANKGKIVDVEYETVDETPVESDIRVDEETGEVLEDEDEDAPDFVKEADGQMKIGK